MVASTPLVHTRGRPLASDEPARYHGAVLHLVAA
jgi:hypothetical protein